MDLILYTLHTLFCSFTIMYQSHPYSRHLILYRLTSKVLELNDEPFEMPTKMKRSPYKTLKEFLPKNGVRHFIKGMFQ